MERTLVLIKPDGVERKLIGEIISIYEKKDLKIVGLKMLKATKEIAEKHYEEHRGREYFKELIEYITEDNICALVIEGNNAIDIIRKVNGDKDHLKSDMGSIRGKYSSNKTRNLVHASDCIESAKREMKIWFPELM
ncbi:nucleoside diphosphate kinase [Clostridiales bacterium oral taxon 876 str. F0540]|nr:nucleoside diphosphate kinase [Clostridiales bacterium oral taxon 876 str. F0540]